MSVIRAMVGRKRWAAPVLLAAIVGVVVASTAGYTTHKSRYLTAQEICAATAILVPCDQIDSLEPARRAALEEDAESVLRSRSPAQANREDAASLRQFIKDHPIEMDEDDNEGDHSMSPGEISSDIELNTPRFREANAWLAPDHLAGGRKNSIFVYVGAAPADPALGLLVRDAEGDTVPNPTEYTGKPTIPMVLPGDHGPGAHITAASRRGVLTIRFSDGSKLRYDGVRGRFLS